MNYHVLSDVLWIVVMAGWGTWDGYRHDKGKPIFLHYKPLAWTARLIVAWVLIQFIYMYPGVNTTAEGWEWFANLCKYCTIGWLVFDLSWNISCDHVKIDHVGTTALTDRVFHNIYPSHPFFVQIVTKMFLIGITTTIAWVL